MIILLKNKDGVITKIDKVTNQKDLGIIFDHKLNFQQHISAKINLANRNLWIIKKLLLIITRPCSSNYTDLLCDPIWNMLL